MVNSTVKLFPSAYICFMNLCWGEVVKIIPNMASRDRGSTFPPISFDIVQRAKFIKLCKDSNYVRKKFNHSSIFEPDFLRLQQIFENVLTNICSHKKLFFQPSFTAAILCCENTFKINSLIA